VRQRDFQIQRSAIAFPSGVNLTPAAVLTNIAPPAAQAFNGPLGIAFDGSS